ncbi:TlpA disulfide reductase family protein [Candidatus Thioglobus sp.]|uniref:TlpA family protein disulfide reductase n=1 Tax=Candidatus Thioglobus sp. TaxID=2026721 RepID=UPI0026398CCD|nr:TlpA disulfide reductase family protein [Candidatus Thioglobus sp.]MDG2394979.1 TlpA disulfide reductase family protein [Candidatus Thioglobus sp.]
MKWLLITILFLSSTLIADDKIEIELSSGEVMMIDTFNAEGDTLYLYLPSERGFGKGHIPTAQQLAFEGSDVWVLDLHTSYMVPKHRSSINKFSVDDLIELISLTQDKGFKRLFFVTSGRGAQLALKAAHQWQSQYPGNTYLKGHIFHSPHLIKGKPELGDTADYVEVAKVSNLPVYMILPQYSTKYFRAKEILQTLELGGSSVFVHRLKGVRGGFHMRNEEDLTQTDLKVKADLGNTYLQASNLLSGVKSIAPIALSAHTSAKRKHTVNETTLKPYKGKSHIALQLKDLKGQKINLNDYQGQVILLNFWASWCKPCIKEIPSLVRLGEQLKPSNFKIITVNVGESAREISEFKKRIKFDLPILLDDKGVAVQDWGVYAYPSNFLLDKDGIIRYSYRGALEWDSPAIVKTIKTLL